MKIVQILPSLKEGGTETGTIDLCIDLKHEGHHVTVISNGGVLVEKLRTHQISHLSWPVHKKNPFTIYLMSRKLIRFIKDNNIDLIHARSRVPGWITYLATRKTKTKWITTCHGYYQKHFGSRVMGWADHMIVASEAIRKHMVQDFKVSADKITLIPRGVDLQRFTMNRIISFNAPIGKHQKLLGFIGRITPIKGHKDFIKALAILKKENFSFKAHIIGTAPNPQYLIELKQLVQQLNLSEEVLFLGHQDNIQEHLKHMDLLVLATTYPEAFGRVIIEAQACGVPVVATKVGGIQEIIDHEETGLLCEPQNPNDLSGKIKRIFLELQKTQSMIQKARIKVENFYSKEQMVKKTLEVYEKILAPKILVIKLSSLGDAILISPSLRALRQKFPKSHITILTAEKCYEIFEYCPYIDEIIVLIRRLNISFNAPIGKHPFDTASSAPARGCASSARTAWRLTPHHAKPSSAAVLMGTSQWRHLMLLVRRNCYDISIDFQNTYWTHFLSFLWRIPQRYGYERKLGKVFLTHSIMDPPVKPGDDPLGPVEHQFQILKLLNIPLVNPALEFWFTDEDQKKASKLCREIGLKIEKPFSIIHIGASWETKKWKPEYLAHYADHLQKTKDLQILLTGASTDILFENEIKKFLTLPVFSLVEKTSLRELAALIQKTHSFLSFDSAALHIASAFDIPTIALFGPTDPLKHRPPSKNIQILSQKVDCGPCYRATCSHHTCMVKLSPEKVLSAYKNL